jgi:hypothetical protein
MEAKKWAAVGLAVFLLAGYNGGQPELRAMRNNDSEMPGTKKKERYGPSLQWLTRLMKGQRGGIAEETKLDFSVLSSMMIAGLASGFKSQVANLIWMKSDEYWHKGMPTRQVPLMEAVVTLDPQFIEAWSTAGWHWAYNIYADLPTRADLKKNEAALRKEQERAVMIGLDYLNRGSEMNPETYRLWFENAWTRGEKAGIYDDRTVELLRTSRAQKDARELEQTTSTAGGALTTSKVQGADIVGRNIGHVYEKQPDIAKALEQYSILIANGKHDKNSKDPLNPPPAPDEPLSAADTALLNDVGMYWGLYGKDYFQIVDLYRSPDTDQIVRNQIRKLVPDIERMVAAHKGRESLQNYETQASGAYISITARYLPAWRLMEAGKLQEAIDTVIGVMNADGVHHLQKLDVLGKVYELRGDAPQVIQGSLKQARDAERESTQEIGLHFLGKLYEKQAEQAKDPAQKKKFAYKAYEAWYRARERSSLDFYARRAAYAIEDVYKFTPPKEIIKAIQESRKSGGVQAAPPPNVQQYQHRH